jgi:hypothetical protein
MKSLLLRDRKGSIVHIPIIYIIYYLFYFVKKLTVADERTYRKKTKAKRKINRICKKTDGTQDDMDE